jgi:hypothetical protein
MALQGENLSELNFDHINLNEVDPNASTVPDGPYNFQVAGVYPKTYAMKNNGVPTGETGNYVSVRFAIVDSDRYAGRSYFEAFFPNKGTAKQLRKIMDATGIPQAEGQPIEDWLKTLQTSGATFGSYLLTKDEIDNRTGKSMPKQHVNLWEVAPAS